MKWTFTSLQVESTSRVYETLTSLCKILSLITLIMRTTHALPCACELARCVVGSIPLDTVHMFWWRLSFSDQSLSEPEVCITEEMEVISKRF